jgi:hypothetical protein
MNPVVGSNAWQQQQQQQQQVQLLEQGPGPVAPCCNEEDITTNTINERLCELLHLKLVSVYDATYVCHQVDTWNVLLL